MNDRRKIGERREVERRIMNSFVDIPNDELELKKSFEFTEFIPLITYALGIAMGIIIGLTL